MPNIKEPQKGTKGTKGTKVKMIYFVLFVPFCGTNQVRLLTAEKKGKTPFSASVNISQRFYPVLRIGFGFTPKSFW
ncbi:MAG TPA: hypothetical protein VF435_15555, partial [Pyrinomonadaceae bacterium]